jgi:ankyrin repeat protein
MRWSGILGMAAGSLIGLSPSGAGAKNSNAHLFEPALQIAAIAGEPSMARTRPLPLHEAAFYGLASWAIELIDRGADIDARDPEGRTPLMVAIAAMSHEVTAALLARGADPMARDGNGDTPLHFAALAGRIEPVTLLLSHGADLSVRSVGGARRRFTTRRLTAISR